ncbi:MAG: transcription antitermination factor NusB [Spirochaetaceae bacterium]|nr:transcription antitermination factor NusB [Spirochaetaceae bacterium]MBO4704712.1 transcription antitermination factor NusB [Spirochaetaceae bacterium]
MARRKGRIIAFQALYSWDVSGMELDDLLKFEWVSDETKERMDDESDAFTRLLISGTIENCAEIDEVIKKHLINWEFGRLNKVDLAILRISVYSLLYQKDIHPTIIIDEAVDISKDFGTDDSYKFVNAVLDNVRKTLKV